MKRVAFITFVLLFVTCLATVSVAQQRAIARVHIPFAFNAHNQSLEAGTYDVLLIGAHILRFQQWQTERGVTLLSPLDVVARDDVKVVFRVYGHLYFMSEVNAPTFRVALPMTREEKEVSKTTKPRIVEIAAN